MGIGAGELEQDVFLRPDGADAQLPVAAGVAADEAHVGKAFRERDDVHRGGLAGIVVAAGQARRAADFQPRVDVDRGVELGGEADDRIVVGVVARDAARVPAAVFDADARAALDPLFHLGAALVGETRIDRRDAGDAVLLGLEDRADSVVVPRGRERVADGAADLEGDGALDAHALDVELVEAVLRDDVALAVEAVEVRVPDAQRDELLARRQAVVGGIEVEFARGHHGLAACGGESTTSTKRGCAAPGQKILGLDDA